MDAASPDTADLISDVFSINPFLLEALNFDNTLKLWNYNVGSAVSNLNIFFNS